MEQDHNPVSKAMISSDHNYYHYDINNTTTQSFDDHHDHLMKTQIANHPCYPDLLAAYIQCQKIGAPPETAMLLEEIDRENHLMSNNSTSSSTSVADPELDYFMESYRDALERFKEELCKPFDEATTFLKKIESQLSKIHQGTFTTTSMGHYAHSDYDDEEKDMMSYGDQVSYDHQRQTAHQFLSYGAGAIGDHDDLKEKLLQKYSGYLTMLKTEFLKKRKKIELPKPARASLLHWWNAHSRWPYPTEEEKSKLSEETGLDQKQITNWFVNQRKRHWKPSEDIKSALVDDLHKISS